MNRSEHPLMDGHAPPWAESWGEDRYGVFAAFRVGNVVHRCRWIPPGRFLMGSPPDEDGRFDREGPQHEVTISRGFWLGEFPCTQDLWQEVTGQNPSEYPSPRRPVEQVSWEDCKIFLERLRERLPELDPRLPTEAEWEYACRAETKTSTYAGDLKVLGDNNGPVLDEIAWYGGNSGVDFDLVDGYDSSWWPEKQYDHAKAGSRLVGLKRPNAWGLYDVLGNVWEWCEDAWDGETGYAPEPRMDPCVREGAHRVIRGGSWSSFARLVRAAYRDGYEPGLRYVNLGFRLALGQGQAGWGGREREVDDGGE